MSYRQQSPFCVQIELVEGCTLACDFCGVNGIREKPGGFKYLELDRAELIAKRLVTARKQDWNPRVEFAMHGEPSVHPKVVEVTRIFRDVLGPSVSMVMFSNGSGFMLPGMLDAVLEAGMNTIGLDAYEHVRIVPRVIEQYSKKYPVYFYPQQREHNLHSGRRVGHRDIVVIQDIVTAEEGNHSDLNTHCGAGMAPVGLPIKARCAKPFRELSIRWNGEVALCCNDFRGEYKIASVLDTPLDDLWNLPVFEAARRRLFHADRDFKPCDKCNAKSMRVGLLPDSKGSWDLPPASDEELALTIKASAGPPLSPIVLRRWEAGDGPRNRMNE